ncbi:MerR family transcriptional regulator [Paenibacillus planticolens]|uniref:MerR family transcriptional regulator n=1 Tax=Paenibacillus planticolens TaxID=2654976 RepID=A0ABX1ZJ61_9BACL|nr:MerR family transcriptional regulator [Paenibacillus planticolens]NOU98803.1 MerR family transcriptional regulator [Paenibacillus planticolens]
MFYSVKDVSEMFQISPHTVRYYTDQELIPGVTRDQNGHRIFDDAALGWLRTIIAFRTAGMSIDMIRHYLDLYNQGEETFPARYQLLVQQQQLTKQKLDDLSRQLEVINMKVQSYNGWIHLAGFTQDDKKQ